MRDDARGAFNVAAEPVIDPCDFGRVLDARPVRVPTRLARTATALGWRAHVQPAPPGRLDLALAVPIMDVARARTELGWAPPWTAGDAPRDVLDGLRDSAGLETPPLAPDTGGHARVRELATGVGVRDS